MPARLRVGEVGGALGDEGGHALLLVVLVHDEAVRREGEERAKHKHWGMLRHVTVANVAWNVRRSRVTPSASDIS